MPTARLGRILALFALTAMAGCSAPTQPFPLPTPPSSTATTSAIRINIPGRPAANRPVEVGVTIPAAGPGAPAVTRLVMDWGDGDSSELVPSDVGREYVLTHVYAARRTYTVTVTTAFADGDLGTMSFLLPVN